MFIQTLLWLFRVRYKYNINFIVDCPARLFKQYLCIGIFEKNFSFCLLHGIYVPAHYITFLTSKLLSYETPDLEWYRWRKTKNAPRHWLSFRNASRAVILRVQRTACIKLWSFYCVYMLCMHMRICPSVYIHMRAVVPKWPTRNL